MAKKIKNSVPEPSYTAGRPRSGNAGLGPVPSGAAPLLGHKEGPTAGDVLGKFVEMNPGNERPAKASKVVPLQRDSKGESSVG